MEAKRKHRFTANKKTRKRQQRANFNRVLKRFGTTVEKRLGVLEMTAPPVGYNLPKMPHVSAKFAYTMPFGVVAVR